MDIVFWLLYAVYLILNALDRITTWLVIRPDHYDREVNPLARWLFIQLRIPRGIIIVEGVTQALVTLFIFWLLAKHPLLTKFLLGFGILVLGRIVEGSLLMLKNQRDLKKLRIMGYLRQRNQ